ncbi:MAG: archaeosine biosynthesis radical SAM protein RaSEA [Candidatus Thermoplasmatota archaeon]|jgi:radical SAM enzyme (TIGR01210 family)|nr:archaeosine biosynthesis radical SAM protein RaSEA [Candidatus Thermoplasmatota archaeon]
MKELNIFCKNLKKNFIPKSVDTKNPVHCWSEKDILDGKIVDAFVIIFRTRGCSWALKSGCTMCGYFNDSTWKNVSDNDILTQFDRAMQKYSGQKIVKIFTSGSFLDDDEIKPEVRKKILGVLSEKTDKISVESRPEYVKDEKLSKIKEIVQPKTFEVGVGLETSNDFLREHAINKGFTFDDYKKSAKLFKKHGFKLKTYVLIKPPFITEKQAVEDCVNTVKDIRSYTDVVSFNPTNVQHHTFVEYLWRRDQYRPPWLWSIVEILKQSKTKTDAYLKCDITGGGSRRGAHNCPNCDHKILNLIAKFSLNQNIKVFEDLDCECKQKWLDQIDIENLTFGSIVDFLVINK